MSFHAGPRLLASAVQRSPRVYFPVWNWMPMGGRGVATTDFELTIICRGRGPSLGFLSKLCLLLSSEGGLG